MSTIESNIKSHTCPTCGGQLKVDLKDQMYECPFCGVAFDYEYFREDTVLELADKARGKEEWTSADKAYDFMLAKEPHNFHALRGKILVAARMKASFRFYVSNLPPDIGALKETARRALEATDEADKEYFEKTNEYVDLIGQYFLNDQGLESDKRCRKRVVEADVH